MTDDINILIKGCIKNDRLSQEKLYRQFYPALLVLCSRFFDDEHDIITALNNGMLQVFKNMEKYDSSKGDVNGWVYKIVRNSAISLVRTKKAMPTFQEIKNDLQIEISVNPFKDSTEETIAMYLRKLSTTSRAVFSLFYLEGYLIKEIAMSLEMKEGTVKWHLHEARKAIKTVFNPTETQVANVG